MHCELCGYNFDGSTNTAHVCIQGNKIARDFLTKSIIPRPLSRVRVKAEWKEVYDSFYNFSQKAT